MGTLCVFYNVCTGGCPFVQVSHSLNTPTIFASDVLPLLRRHLFGNSLYSCGSAAGTVFASPKTAGAAAE